MSRPVLSGKALQKAIIDAARRNGWDLIAHFPSIQDARGTWRTPVAADGKGFPDLMICRERIVFIEVKGDGDKLRPEQERWIEGLLNAGAEAYVFTPAHWPEAVEAVLKIRGRP